MSEKPRAIFTIDVEDWYHAAVMQPYIGTQTNGRPRARLVHTLEQLEAQLASYQATATLFCLSSLPSECYPILRRMASQGHEIASHGVSHQSLSKLSHQALKQELIQSKNDLEQLTAVSVIGFRAPNFSITDEAIHLLKETGYTYDSSVFNVPLHRGYGRLTEFEVADRPLLLSNELWEFPLSTYKLGGVRLPWAGGAYSRHLPFTLFAHGAKKLAKSGYYHFYIHPWEVDLFHPEVPGIRKIDQLRHFRNMKNMPNRLEQLHQQIQFTSIQDYHAHAVLL